MAPSLSPITANDDSDSGAQWRLRQRDLLTAFDANGGCVIGAIDDSAICAIGAISANDSIGTITIFDNGAIAIDVIGTNCLKFAYDTIANAMVRPFFKRLLRQPLGSRGHWFEHVGH